jgi:hypothetical protein
MRALEAARLAKDRLGAYLVLGVLSGSRSRSSTTSRCRPASRRSRADAAAHELRRLLHDRDARGVRLDPERQDAPVYQLAANGAWRGVGAERPHVPPHAHPHAHTRHPMTKEMIIASNGHETRVAILEDDLLAEIFVERERSRGVVGNVYKGRVSKVLPGMQSAFVDIGLERDGFLYVSDVVNTLEEFERLSGEEEDEGPVAALAAVPAATGDGANGETAGRGVGAPRSGAVAAAPAAAWSARTAWARTEDRGAREGGPGDHRPGRQGAARHQGRAPDLARHAARPVPGLHAHRGPRRACRGRSPAARSAPDCAASCASSGSSTSSAAA